jgi:hypothetical protein
MGRMTGERTPDWLGLANAEREHFQDTRAMQWKVHLGVWALLVVILYATYTTDVFEPVPCWACWMLQSLIGIDLVWNSMVQYGLETSRANWYEYESQAAGQPMEFLVSMLRLRALLGVLLPSGVTGILAMAACYLLNSPPIRGV